MDVETRSSSPPISLNCNVLLELVDTSGQAEQREFRLVPTEQADVRSGLLDENSPLGRALLGHHAGQTLPYRAGDLKEVRILAVQGGDEPAPSEAADKRRKAVRKASAQSEITSQMIFSTASGSKWGDYEVDVDKLLDDEE